MIALKTAVYGKLSGSALADHIGTRMFSGRAEPEAPYPYIVYIIVTNWPDKTFTEVYEETTIQFSLFSDKSADTEIENMYADLKTLYDETSMAIVGAETLIWMRWENASQMIEDHTTPDGLVRVWAYHVDFAFTVKI